jgi:hypothetical protein
VSFQSDKVEEILADKNCLESGLISRIFFAHATAGAENQAISEEESGEIIRDLEAFFTKLLPLLVPTHDGKPIILESSPEVLAYIGELQAEVDRKVAQNKNYPWVRRHEHIHRIAATLAIMEIAQMALDENRSIVEYTPVIQMDHVMAAEGLVECSEMYATPKIPNAVVMSAASKQAKWSDAIGILTANGGSMKKSDFADKTKIRTKKFDEFLKDCPSVEITSVRARGVRGAPTKYVRFKSAPKAPDDAPEDAPEAPVASEDPVAPEGPTSASEGDSDELLGIDDLSLE